jgi:hypothetical protein
MIYCSVNRTEYVVPLLMKATFHLPGWVMWCNVCQAVHSHSTFENTLHYTTNDTSEILRYVQAVRTYISIYALRFQWW